MDIDMKTENQPESEWCQIGERFVYVDSEEEMDLNKDQKVLDSTIFTQHMSLIGKMPMGNVSNQINIYL